LGKRQEKSRKKIQFDLGDFHACQSAFSKTEGDYRGEVARGLRGKKAMGWERKDREV